MWSSMLDWHSLTLLPADRWNAWLCLLSCGNLHLNVFGSKYISTTWVNLANLSSMLRKHAYKDSLFPLTVQILIPTASITTADCLLLYSLSASVQLLVSQCFWGENKSLSCSTLILAQFWSSYEQGGKCLGFPEDKWSGGVFFFCGGVNYHHLASDSPHWLLRLIGWKFRFVFFFGEQSGKGREEGWFLTPQPCIFCGECSVTGQRSDWLCARQREELSNKDYLYGAKRQRDLQAVTYNVIFSNMMLC